MSNKFEMVVTAVDKASKPLEQIGKNIDKLNKPLSNVNKKSGDFHKQLGAGLAQVKKVSDAFEISSPFTKLLGIGMGVGSVGAIGEFLGQLLSSVGRWGTNVSRVSDRTSVPMRDVQRLEAVGRLSGVGPDAVDSGLRGLGSTLQDAKYGRNIRAANILKSLGVQIGTTPTGAPDTAQAFEDIAEAIKNIKNPETQNVVARELGLEELLPMLVKGRQGIRQLADEAERAGQVMSDKGVKGAEEFGRSLDRLKSSIESAGRETVNPLVSPAKSLVDAASDVLDKKPLIDPDEVNLLAKRMKEERERAARESLPGRRKVSGKIIDESDAKLGGGSGASIWGPEGFKGPALSGTPDGLDGSKSAEEQRTMERIRILLAERNVAKTEGDRAALEREVSAVAKQAGINSPLDPHALAEALVAALQRNPIPVRPANGQMGAPSVGTTSPVGMP